MSLALDAGAPVPVMTPVAVAAPRRFPPWQLVLSLLLLSIVIAGVCAKVAYLLAKQQDEVWAARADVEYRGDSWVESQAVALSSRSLWEDTARAEGIEPEEFAKDFKPQLIAGTQVLRLQYEDIDAARAERIIDQLTGVYIDRFSEPPTAERNVTAMLEADLLGVQREIFAVESELNTIEVFANQPVPPRLTTLQTKLSNLNADKAAIENSMVQLELDAERSLLTQPRVLNEPFVLDEPVAPAPLRRAVLGALAGLVLSVIIGFVALRRYLT